MANLLEQLGDSSVLAVQGYGRDWPRPLFGQSLIPDTWQAILESPEGWRKFYAAGADPRPADDARVTLVRARPIVVPFDFRDLASSDDLDIHAGGEVLVRWPTRDDDLAALAARLRQGGMAREQGGTGNGTPPGAMGNGTPLPVLRSPDLTAHLASSLHSALRTFIRRFTAETLLQSDGRNDLAVVLREAMPELALEWGLVLERVNKLELRSRTHSARIAHDRDAADRLAKLQTRQTLDAAAFAATQQRIASVQDILSRLQSDAADGKSWREMLPALDPTERTRILRNLWRITPAAEPTRSLLAIGGQTVVWLDIANPDRVLRRVDLPNTLGPLRSIWSDDSSGRAYVGATTGVWVIERDDTLTACPAAASSKPTHRFNAVRAVGDWIIATHPQLGVWTWLRSTPDPGVAIIEPENGKPRSIRALTFAGERLICALDDQLFAIDARSGSGDRGGMVLGGPLGPTTGSTIHAVAASAREVFAACGDGSILRLALEGPDAGWTVTEQLDQPPAAIGLRTFGDLTELLIPTARRGVLAIYVDDDVRTSALPAPTGLAGMPASLNRVAARADALAALSPDLGRVYILTHAQADESPREILLARLLGAPIEDLTLDAAAPSPATGSA